MEFPPQLPEPCLIVTIGIGNQWLLEDTLANAGCVVHAFDPTIGLHSAHAIHAHARAREYFYFLGLGEPSTASATNGSKLGDGYGKVNTSRLLPLDRLLDVATIGRTHAAVDVLKIDCEGCEWEAFERIARLQPSLLSSVRVLLLELHLLPELGLQEGAQLTRLLHHLVHDHGFELYRRTFNAGFREHRNRVPAELISAGLPGFPCCVELHLVRPRDLLRREQPKHLRCHFGGGEEELNRTRWQRAMDGSLYSMSGGPLKAYDGIFLNPKTEQQYGLPALAERAKLDRWARAQQG